MNIRAQTYMIVRRGPEFLVGRILYTKKLRWSISAWDAWRTRDIESAEKVARKVGGDLWMFNPVAGQLRKFKGGAI